MLEAVFVDEPLGPPPYVVWGVVAEYLHIWFSTIAPSLDWRVCLKAARVGLTLGLEICYTTCSACGLVFCDEVQQAGKLAQLCFDGRSVRRVCLQFLKVASGLENRFCSPLTRWGCQVNAGQL